MLSHRLCTAPMMDWSDRHCRFFFRQLAPHAVVYTEMITTGALLHGDVPRHLDFDPREHPVALQLGGSEPDELAACAQLGARWGYDEINLNCGCPSERVQRGAFGACLMAEPELVADCMKAMQDAASIPVTVKHRLGIDRAEDYDFVRRFVETVARRAGCRTFVVHARNAVLKGLSPKDNREIPRLRYEEVHRLQREFPELEIVANGGIATLGAVAEQLAHAAGVMLGRAAYHDSYCLATIDAQLFGGAAATHAVGGGADARVRDRPGRARDAAARDRAAHAGPLPGPTGRACLAPHVVRCCSARAQRPGLISRCGSAGGGSGRRRRVKVPA